VWTVKLGADHATDSRYLGQRRHPGDSGVVGGGFQPEATRGGEGELFEIGGGGRDLGPRGPVLGCCCRLLHVAPLTDVVRGV
jgi:hypothetical protein